MVLARRGDSDRPEDNIVGSTTDYCVAKLKAIVVVGVRACRSLFYVAAA